MENASKFHASESNAFAEAALTGAYDESGEWLDELNKYINDNLDYFVGEIQQKHAGFVCAKAGRDISCLGGLSECRN